MPGSRQAGTAMPIGDVAISARDANAPPAPGGARLSAVDPAIVLEVKELVKEFPGTRALDGVDLQIRAGEVHALLGENGAGKSTLIRAICGASQPTAGSIFVDGAAVSLKSPQQALALGIAVVHQHFNLVPQLSVGENLCWPSRCRAAPDCSSTGARWSGAPGSCSNGSASRSIRTSRSANCGPMR